MGSFSGATFQKNFRWFLIMPITKQFHSSIFTRVKSCPQKDLYTNVYSHFIHNRKTLDLPATCHQAQPSWAGATWQGEGVGDTWGKKGDCRGAAADRVTDCRPEAPLGGSPFASLGPAVGEAQRVGEEGRVECLSAPCLPRLYLLSASSSLSDSF